MTGYSYSRDGRRFTIHGDTRVAPKGSLGKHGLGLNFDWDAKIWWSGKEEIAKAAVAKLESLAKAAEENPSAHYAKLADGSWGARVPSHQINTGDSLVVVKRSGETKTETISTIVERSSDDRGEYTLVTLARTARSNGGARRSRSSYGRRSYVYDSAYCGGICPVGGFRCSPKNGPCHDCE
ncbi:MAG TPA: hypothetical protein VLV83_24670 [Acidobacteriota bacterium]|nr:hypothetical protein [Acidobacteriota bacterium]